LLLLASATLAFFGLMTYTDSLSHEQAERRWSVVCMVVAALLSLTSVSSILSLILRRRTAWSAAVGLSGLSMLGIGVLIWAGFSMLVANGHRGGDWAAVAGLARLLFGVVCPGLVGLLTLAGAWCLWSMQRRTKDAAA
jgi:hypothetical protein